MGSKTCEVGYPSLMNILYWPELYTKLNFASLSPRASICKLKLRVEVDDDDDDGIYIEITPVDSVGLYFQVPLLSFISIFTYPS